MTTPTPTRSLPWWLIVLVMVTLPLVLYNYPDIYQDLPEVWKHRRGSFRVIFEMNYPTWWTSFILFAAALLFLESAYIRNHSSPSTCWLLALLVTGLSYDEAGSIHERVSLLSMDWFDSPWTGLSPFALAGIFALIYGLIGLSRMAGGRRVIVFIVSGFTLFALVVVQEYLEHHREFSKFISMTLGITNAGSRSLEEVTEMIGAMLVLTGAALVRNGGAFDSRLGFVLVRPSNIPNLVSLLLIGLVVHSVIAFYFLPDTLELTVRGNPAGWYPSAVFFILFTHAYWQFHSLPEAQTGIAPAPGNPDPLITVGWLFLSFFFLLCSIGFMHNFGHVIADAIPGISKPFYFNPSVIYSAIIGSVIVFMLWLELFSGKRLIYLVLLLGAPFLEFYLHDRGAPFAASGVTSFLIAGLFLPSSAQTSG